MISSRLRTSLSLAAATGLLALAPAALAQPDAAGDTATTGAEETPEPPSLDPTGTDENPDTAGLDGGVAVAGPDAPPTMIDDAGYPLEEVDRPITMPEFESELSLTTGFTFNPAVNNSVLRGRFGVTRQFQLGLTYNIGGLYDDDASGPKKTTFNPGKSLGFDGTFLVFDWLAIQAAVPMYLDPFAIGLRLGAPIKFKLTRNFAIGGLHDLVDFKLKAFVPSLDRENFNEAFAALVASNSKTDDGNLRIQGYGVYQHSPKLAFTGEFGARFADFDSFDAAYPLWFTAQYSVGRNFDIAGTAGFENLDEAAHSIGLFVGAKLRL